MQPTSFAYEPAIFSATVMARRYGTTDPFYRLGDCEKVTIDPKVKTIERKSGEVFGGDYAVIHMIDNIALKLSQSDFTRSNVTRALFGEDSVIAAQTFVGVTKSARKAEYIPLCPNPKSVVVKSADDTVTYVQGVDYAVNKGGIVIIDGSTIPNADPAVATPIKVSYTAPECYKIEAFVNTDVMLEMELQVTNNATAAKKASVYKLHKVKFSPTASLDLVSDKLGSITVEGRLLVDSNRVSTDGSEVSQFMSIVSEA